MTDNDALAEAELNRARSIRPDFGTVSEDEAKRLHAIRPPFERGERRVDAERWNLADWRAILRVENHVWPDGLKASFIANRFGVSPARYFQRLNQVIDMPEALEYDAPLVYRLRAAREVRAGARAARSLIRRRGAK